MIKLMLRLVTLATFPMALIAAPSFIPAFAMEGGSDHPAPNSTAYPAPSYPPSSYPRRPGTKGSHKIKNTAKRSSIDRGGSLGLSPSHPMLRHTRA